MKTNHLKLFLLLLCFSLMLGTLKAQNWIFRYNLTAKEYQSLFDHYASRYIPEDLNVTSINGELRFAVILRENQPREAWEARHNLTKQGFMDFSKQIVNKGLVPYSVTPYLNSAGELRYAGYWKRNWSGPAATYYWTDTSSSYLPTINSTINDSKYNDYWPNSFAVFNDDKGGLSFAMAMQKYLNSSEKPSVHYDLDLDDLNDWYEELLDENCIPLSISVYHSSFFTNATVLATENRSQKDWGITLDNAADELADTIEELKSVGYSPYLVKGYNFGGRLKYLVVWRK